jgi:hypothetical protein
MRAKISRTVNQIVKVNNTGGVLTAQSPITLKNQINEINSIEDIRDVSEIDVTDGATIVYNASNDKYEIKHIQIEQVEGIINLDGGTF